MATMTYEWVNATQPFFANDTGISGDQGGQAIASLAKGGYFLAWEAPDNAYVEGRAIRDNGASFDSEFQVNSTTEDSQKAPSVAGLKSGRAIVTFTDYSTDAGGDIRAGLFAKDGTPVDLDFPLVADANLDTQSQVTALADGGFAVVWTRDFGGGDYDTRAAVFNANGSVRNPNVGVDSASDIATTSPDIAGLAGGGFVIAWQEKGIGGVDTHLHFRRYDSGGMALDLTPVDLRVEDDNRDVQVVGLNDGGFAVAYIDGS